MNLCCSQLTMEKKTTEMQTLRYARTQSVVCFAHAHVHERFIWGFVIRAMLPQCFWLIYLKWEHAYALIATAWYFQCQKCESFIHCAKLNLWSESFANPIRISYATTSQQKKMNQVTGNNKKKAFEQLSASDECHKL